MAPQPVSQAILAPGTVLTKRYRIEALIGSGGYASVYRATDLTFGYQRAIKEVSDPDPGVRTQFRLEAELLINSKHPNIPHGYHLIEDFGRLFLVMDYVEGKDLEELLNDSLTQRHQPLEEAQVLRWALDICGALIEMHNLRTPVIHRDIKPANIKITLDGKPVLIDFGLAKLQKQNGPTMTAAQGVSPGFAPPEQYMAKGRTDARTDIYGLGATLYACLTGKDPPEAPARLLAQTGAAAAAGMTLVAIRRMNPRVSEETDRIVLRALELSPGKRQQTALQFRDELAASLQRLTGGADATLVMGRGATQGQPAVQSPDASARRPRTPAPQATPGAFPGVAGGTGGRLPALGAAAGRLGGNQAPATPAPPSQRTGKQPIVSPDRPTQQQPAAMANQRTGKQQVIAARSETATALATPPKGMPAVPRDTTFAAGKTNSAKSPAVIPSNSAKSPAVKAPPSAPAPASQAEPGAWIRLGGVRLGGFGKFMLALAAIETLWGVVILAVSVIALTTRGEHLPIPQLVIGWLVAVLLLSVIGGQAISRPAYRRGVMSGLRRGFQGTVLTLYSLAVHAVAIWGAVIFLHDQSNPTLAIVTFLAFGVCVLVGGVFGVWNTLG